MSSSIKDKFLDPDRQLFSISWQHQLSEATFSQKIFFNSSRYWQVLLLEFYDIRLINFLDGIKDMVRLWIICSSTWIICFLVWYIEASAATAKYKLWEATSPNSLQLFRFLLWGFLLVNFWYSLFYWSYQVYSMQHILSTNASKNWRLQTPNTRLS